MKVMGPPPNTRKTLKDYGSYHDALVLHLGMMAEVHQQPKTHTGRAEVVMKLGAMLVGQRGHSFDFDDDSTVADEIRRLGLLQRPPFVGQAKLRLCFERNTSLRKLDLETFLEDRLKKSRPFVPVDLKAGTHDGE
jgi:hypothetical protein